MGRNLTKAQLLKSQLPADTVEVPGKGTVLVRALSRAEVVDELNTVDRSVPGAFEARLVAMSMVDPVVTEEEVAAWRTESQPEEVGAIIDKLSEMSALTKDAAKDAYKEFESDPDASFRALPGGEAVDDGGAAPG